MEDRKILNEQELEQVAGGARSSEDSFTTRRNEFESAWTSLRMESKGYTGNKKAELFEEWEMAGYSPDAVAFLSKLK